MPPLIAAIPLVIGAISTAFATVTAFISTAILTTTGISISSALVGKLLITGAAMVAMMFLNHPKQGFQSPINLRIDPTTPRQIAVGRTATGGSSVYAFTGSWAGGTPNKHLVRVIDLSDYPISNVVAILAGGVTLKFNGDMYSGSSLGTDIPSDCSCYNFFFDSHHRPHMWIRVYKGVLSGAVADPFLVANDPTHRWDTTCKGNGVAYAVVMYDFDYPNNGAFPNGEPSLTFVLDGAPVYDQRFDSTRTNPTRVGAQRLSDPTTWQYVDPGSAWYPDYGGNCAVLVQQLLRGFYVNGSLMIGAEADDRDLADSMLLSAYNICDIDQPTEFGTVGPDFPHDEPLYRAGMMLDCSRSIQDNMSDIVVAMDGQVWDRAGNITILPGRAMTPVLTLTDEDIDWTEEASWQPIGQLNAIWNKVLGNYIAELDFFQARPYPIQTNSTYVTADGETIAFNQDFQVNASAAQVQRVTYRALQRGRQQGILSFVGALWLLQLEQGDWFELTSARWDFTSKIFTVIRINFTPDWKVSIIAQENDPSIDNWSLTQEVDMSPNTAVASTPWWQVPDYYLDPPTQLKATTTNPLYPASVPTLGSPAITWPSNSHPTINWTIATVPDHYRILRNTVNDPTTATDVSGSLVNTTTSFTDTAASVSGTTYFWWVVSYNSGETYSAAAGPVAGWIWNGASVSGSASAGANGGTASNNPISGYQTISFTLPVTGHGGNQGTWNAAGYTFSGSVTAGYTSGGSGPTYDATCCLLRVQIVKASVNNLVAEDFITYQGTHADSTRTRPIWAFTGNYVDSTANYGRGDTVTVETSLSSSQATSYNTLPALGSTNHGDITGSDQINITWVSV